MKHAPLPDRPAPKRLAAALGLALLATACGGGGGGSSSSSPGTDGPGIFTGSPWSVTGRIVDAYGAPLQGAQVELQNQPSTNQTTGANGVFVMSANDGNYTLNVFVEDALATRASVVVAGADQDVGDVQAMLLATGFVLDGAQSRVPFAEVVLTGKPDEYTVADANGNFTLHTVAGQRDMHIRHQGSEVWNGTVSLALPGPVQLGGFQVYTDYSGRLLDGLMQPLEGAVVTVDTTPLTWTTTNAAGLFSAQLPEGSYTLTATYEGVPVYSEPLDVTLSPPVSIGRRQVLVRTLGRVVDTEQNPVKNAEVWAHTTPPMTYTTGTDGRFELDLPAGDLLLSVRLNGVTSAQGNVLTDLDGSVEWVGDLVVDDDLDTDGDGLSDFLETRGWSIPVNQNGGASIHYVAVTSNPYSTDSDGDVQGDEGLDDAEEFALRTDPRRLDTDGDLLSDWEELAVYRSNPAHVDTDGDALLKDEHGAPIGQPNPSLFDGYELLYAGTSPTLDDTDGDGLSDHREILGGGTHPLVADQPLLDIEIIGDPLVALNSEVSQGTVAGTLQRDESSQQRSDSTTTQTSTENQQQVSASGEVNYPWGGSLSVSASASWKQSTMNASTSNFSTSSLSSLQSSYQQSSNTSFKDGTIRAAIRINNRSDLSFLIQDLSVLVYRVRPTFGAGALQVVGTLFEQDGALGGLGTAPGYLVGPQGDFSFEAANEKLNYQPIVEYMKNPGGLFFEVGSYSLLQVNEQGEAIGNYDAIAQNVVERTALLVIDYGGGEIERYAIATNVRRNPDGSAAGITMREALTDVLGIPYETATGTGCPSADFPGSDGRQLLTGVRNFLSSPEILDPGGNVPVCTETPIARQWWVVAGADTVEHDAPAGPSCSEGGDYFVDFDDIRLLPGERVTLMYMTDADNDGLSAREEVIYGTSDTNCDTDGDGISDGEEVADGWTVRFVNCPDDGFSGGQFDYLVYSSPRFPDIDGDGLEDTEERILGTDPNDPDTDGDGDIDSEDACPTEPPVTGQGIPSAGLEVYYRFNADDVLSGPRTPDFAGNGHDGDIEDVYVSQMWNTSGLNGVWLWPDRDGRFDRSFWFSNFGSGGSDDQVGMVVLDPSTGPKFSSSFTWAAWIFVDEASIFKEANTIIGHQNFANLRIRNNQGFNRRLAFEIDPVDAPGNAPLYRTADTTSAIELDTWTFVCCTVEYIESSGQTNVTLYRDNQAVGGSTFQTEFVHPNNGYPLRLGTTWSVFGPPGGDAYRSYSFIGGMDDVRMYDRALTQDEVLALYNEVVPDNQ